MSVGNLSSCGLSKNWFQLSWKPPAQLGSSASTTFLSSMPQPLPGRGPDSWKWSWLAFQGQQVGNSGDLPAAQSPRSLGNTVPGNCLTPPALGVEGREGGSGV